MSTLANGIRERRAVALAVQADIRKPERAHIEFRRLGPGSVNGKFCSLTRRLVPLGKVNEVTEEQFENWMRRRSRRFLCAKNAPLR